jgi:hypothetical protein
MALLRIEGLPDAPLDAAAAFHANWLAPARRQCIADRSTVLVFAPADHTHRGWRLAVVQDLARAAAPRRINAVASASDAAIAASARYLDRAEGVTGQYLPLDDAGGLDVLS